MEDNQFQLATFLFVTYNRAPHKNFRLNPLTWAFQTLISSDKYITEYLVIVDGSTDFTIDNLEWLKREYDLNIRYIYRKEKKGCSYSRKQGIEELKTECFFMGDDDCLYAEDFVLGTLFYDLFIRESYGIEPAIIAQPVFDLKVDFTGVVDESLIGKTKFEDAWFYHNFDKKSTNDENITFQDVLLNKPIDINTFKGVTFGRKSAIVDAGNFIDLSMWANDYSEHIELSHRLEVNGNKMYYIPDKRLSCVHLRFGTPDTALDSELESLEFNNVNLTLGEMHKMSVDYSKNSGCRVSDKEFIFTKIGSFLAFYLKVSEDFALKFVKMEYENLVVKPNKLGEDQSKEIFAKSEEYRKGLWAESVNKGIEVAESQTGKSFKNFRNKLKVIYFLT